MKWYYFLLVFIFLCGSAFFSMMDMAYSIVDKNKLKKEIEKGNKKAPLALKISEDYDFTISTILLGNNVANIFASSFVTLIGLALADIPNSELIITTILTIVVIIFCEFLPKAVAKKLSFKLVLNLSSTINFFLKAFFFLAYPVSQLFKFFNKLFEKRHQEETKIDEEVLTEMIDTIEEEGEIVEEKADLLRSVVDANDTEAYEIMTPRVDVFMIDVNDEFKDIIEQEELFKHSRIPVYEDTVDNIVGVLPVRSLTKYILSKRYPKSVRHLLYQPLVIPRNTLIMDLLEDFKEEKIHIAIVKDEFGGTEGIITMEDILEELVGEIYDEADEIELDIINRNTGTYTMSGSINIDDAFEEIGFDDWEEEVETSYTTIGGFCQEILERFAKKGDKFIFKHYQFKVLEADEFTITRLQIKDLQFDKDKDE